MKLRDFYPSLTDLCDDLALDKQEILDKMQKIGYSYDEKGNKFI